MAIDTIGTNAITNDAINAAKLLTVQLMPIWAQSIQ